MTEPQVPPYTEPTTIPAAPKPGWTTSEFLSTMMVHAVATLAILLDLLHVNWSRGLSTVEAAIPVAAVAISALLQAAYSDYRTKLKVEHLQQTARVRIVQIEKEISKVETVANIVHSPLVAGALSADLGENPELANAMAVGPIATPQVVVAPTIQVPPQAPPPPSACPRCGATEVTDDRQ